MSHRNFTSKDAALTINYIGFVFRTLVAEGYSAEALLQDTALCESDLLNPDFRCTFDQHKTFVLNAIALTGDPHLGPRMAARFNPLNIGLPASAALSSDVFATALNVLQQFVSLNFSILSFDYRQEGDELIIRWHPAVDVSDIEYFVVGSSIVVTENFWKLLLGERQVTLYAELALPEPDGWAEFEPSLGFSVHFNAPFSRVVLPARYLHQPLSGTDPVLHQNMLRLCEKQRAETFFEQGLDARLRHLIVKHRYQNLPIEQAADALGLSERSLRRQLSQAGSSYKKIVDELRQARARELLSVSGLPVSTIAYDLGFSDPSNFARTFKRWVGLSPVEYREGLGTGKTDP
ncbi:AraC family transcriptional regulator [Pseudoteredinibacter isoporae]|uniref:AraC family transcriptional regulator n=1 Tax=Pseudoteredinibacter isoporae TaxID=570281 RepID=UPI003102BA2B